MATVVAVDYFFGVGAKRSGDFLGQFSDMAGVAIVNNERLNGGIAETNFRRIQWQSCRSLDHAAVL